MIGHAFTRAVSPALSQCQLTHVGRKPINAARAVVQHEAYEAALVRAGFSIERMTPLPDAPDGVFVEDTAILLGEHAVITRPGSAARTAETASTATALGDRFILSPLTDGKMDGGDVLLIGRRLYVGLSVRTNRAGANALASIATSLGYTVIPVRVEGCLHLKTAVTFAGSDRAGTPVLMVNPAWVDPTCFVDVQPFIVGEKEPFAANTLRAGDKLIVATGAPRTYEALAERGFDMIEVDIAELQKAEAGLTCMSLISARSVKTEQS